MAHPTARPLESRPGIESLSTSEAMNHSQPANHFLNSNQQREGAMLLVASRTRWFLKIITNDNDTDDDDNIIDDD